MNKIRNIDSSLIDQNENSLCYTHLFGKENMNDSDKAHFRNATFRYLNRSNKSKSLSLQLITAIIVNDSILFELTSLFESFYLF